MDPIEFLFIEYQKGSDICMNFCKDKIAKIHTGDLILDFLAPSSKRHAKSLSSKSFLGGKFQDTDFAHVYSITICVAS